MSYEQIEKAADKYADDNFIESIVTEEPWPSAMAAFAKAFRDGADYALSHQWVSVDERLPEDGELILIREYYRSAKSGRFVNHVREFWYFKQYSFRLKEDIYRDLIYRITHWMPIPQLNNEK